MTSRQNIGDRNTGNLNTGNRNTGNQNTGNRNTGHRNTGDWNTGHWNTGNWNTGDRNTGHWNTGDLNTGNRNTGHWNTSNQNTGNLNTGNPNTGDRNTGNWNTGNQNTGNQNTGNRNTGDRNTGNWNTGNQNTGNWNTGNHSSSTLSTINGLGYAIFNTPLEYGDLDSSVFPSWMYFSLTEWVDEDRMTEQEKIDNPSFHTTEGFLRQHDYKEAFRSSFNGATEDEKRAVMDLPHWDNEIFKEISGIDVEGYFKKSMTRKIKIGGIDYDAEEVEEKLKDLKPIR